MRLLPCCLGSVVVWLQLGAAQAAENLLRLTTETATFEVDTTGALSSIKRVGQADNSLAPGQPAPLLSLRIGGEYYNPVQATWDPNTRRLTLNYPSVHASVVVAATPKTTHVTFELLEVHSERNVELALWGPYPLRLRGKVGEIVGVVRDHGAAVGIQALNPKTLGGYPAQENDIDTEYGADDAGDYLAHFAPELLQAQSFRGDTARPTPFGSVLQAYTRNRSEPRILSNWGHEKYPVLAFADGGIVGSRIALFAVAEPQALETIGAIELAEGLPHPLLDGEWAKLARGATASYLIVDFGEDTVDRAIEMTKRAGLSYLYHSSPFATWGHFQLKPQLFPRGWESFRTCVEKARRAGVRLGFHTLSNFITPNDPYVTPEPDYRLAQVGGSVLSGDIDASAKEIAVIDPAYFRSKSALNTVRLEAELVRYGSVSEQAPWRLLDCERGAWGTLSRSHSQGTPVGRLLDHDYKVFLTDASLAQEVARKIAEFCNFTGALQLSFDGLEGNWSTGYGQYGRTLFTHAWYQALARGVQGQVINDASNPGHFNWHIHTRMNWGEPWYAGFRESQTLYRFKNQVLFERNLMPHMLGWFALRSDTSLEDAEWLLARAAGFDAGFTLATSLASTAQLAADPGSADTAKKFGATSAILAAIAQWETARLSGAFSPDLKAQLQDNRREFHLQPVSPKQWDLYEVQVARFNHDLGSESGTEFRYTNSFSEQPLQFMIHSTAKVPVKGISLELNGSPNPVLTEVTLPPGGNLKCNRNGDLIVADASGKELSRIPIESARLQVKSGVSRVKIKALGVGAGPLQVELRVFGPAIRVPSARP